MYNRPNQKIAGTEDPVRTNGNCTEVIGVCSQYRLLLQDFCLRVVVDGLPGVWETLRVRIVK